MLCGNLSLRGLEVALAPHMHRSVWPGLDTGNRDRIRRLAKRLGVWDALGKRIAPREPVQALARSLFREFARTGQRAGYERVFSGFRNRTSDAAMALWLGHPAADPDLLQDRLWYWCEMTSWIIPAHEGVSGELNRKLELFSTEVGVELSEILYLLGDQLDAEVSQRLGEEIDRRILEPAHDYRVPHWWATCDMNWNHVCNANLIQTALYRIRQPDRLSAFVLPLLHRLDYALNGFASDGGCLEGPGYWEYGFGHYVQAALAMHQRTGGKVDLMSDSRVEAICRYPMAVYLAPPLRTCFADGDHGYVGVAMALAINRFRKLPELLALTAPRRDGSVDARNLRSLALYDGTPRPTQLALPDAVLPAMGQARMSAGRGSRQVTVAALAGRNDVPHNHNDIGSFMVLKHGRLLLVDPGRPTYTRDTFGPGRYAIMQCRSLGHSVPIVNGHEQMAGGQYTGTLTTANLDVAVGKAWGGNKTLRLDLPRAYPDATLQRLVRTLTLGTDGSLTLEDDCAFSRKPKSVEEGFVTFEPAAVAEDGASVTIGTGTKTLRLAALDTTGRFRIDEYPEAIETDIQRRLLRRIVFVPAPLSATMRLLFSFA